MTSIITKKGAKVGPKLRKPNGEVYLDIICSRDNDNNLTNFAKFYRDLIGYALPGNVTFRQMNHNDSPISHQPNIEKFKVDEIAGWILERNQELLDYYSGFSSHIPKHIRKNSLRNRIKDYLCDLEQWGLIEQLGEVEAATKNGLKTKLYQFTDMGYIVALLLEYDYSFDACIKLHEMNNLERMRIAKHAIFDHIKLLLENFHSYMTDFLAMFYVKCIELDTNANTPFITKDKDGRDLIGFGIFDNLLIILITILNSGKYHFPNAIEYLSAALNMILTDKKTAHTAVDLFLKALNELPENTRRMIIAHEKAGIENMFIISQPSKDWEKVWFKNRNEFDILVLYGVCQNRVCKRRGRPVLIPYHLYRERMVTATTVDYNNGFEPIGYFTGDCQFCETKDSIYVFDSFSNVRRFLNKILEENPN